MRLDTPTPKGQNLDEHETRSPNHYIGASQASRSHGRPLFTVHVCIVRGQVRVVCVHALCIIYYNYNYYIYIYLYVCVYMCVRVCVWCVCGCVCGVLVLYVLYTCFLCTCRVRVCVHTCVCVCMGGVRVCVSCCRLSRFLSLVRQIYIQIIYYNTYNHHFINFILFRPLNQILKQ